MKTTEEKSMPYLLFSVHSLSLCVMGNRYIEPPPLNLFSPTAALRISEDAPRTLKTKSARLLR